MSSSSPVTSIHIKPHALALSLSTFLSSSGYLKGSFSQSGALAAFIVGYGTMANEDPTFGVGLIVFYLVGSRVTKVGRRRKKELEEDVNEVSEGNEESDESESSDVGYRDTAGEVDKTNNEKENATNDIRKNEQKKGMKKKKKEKTRRKDISAGNRNAWQVLSNSLPALFASLIYRFTFTSERLFPLSPSSSASSFSAASASSFSTPYPFLLPGHRTQVALLGIALGHFSTCLGDTLASELGILNTDPNYPILITTLNPCPPGTNGGVSPLGLVVSAVGGGMMGVTWVVVGVLKAATDVGGRRMSTSEAIKWIALGTTAGLLGSLLDSVLGATLQLTLFSETRKVILTRTRTVADSAAAETDRSGDHGRCGNTKSKTKKNPHNVKARKEQKQEEEVETQNVSGTKEREERIRVVSGRDVLSNNAVNAISSAVVGLITGWAAWRWI